jgi:hypothetical protein
MNWISINKEKPTPEKKVWVGSVKNQTVYMGYYSKSMDAFFNNSGNGIPASHWQEIVHPKPPTK